MKKNGNFPSKYSVPPAESPSETEEGRMAQGRVPVEGFERLLGHNQTERTVLVAGRWRNYFVSEAAAPDRAVNF